jgi:hypothetical protein
VKTALTVVAAGSVVAAEWGAIDVTRSSTPGGRFGAAIVGGCLAALLLGVSGLLALRARVVRRQEDEAGLRWLNALLASVEPAPQPAPLWVTGAGQVAPTKPDRPAPREPEQPEPRPASTPGPLDLTAARIAELEARLAIEEAELAAVMDAIAASEVEALSVR